MNLGNMWGDLTVKERITIRRTVLHFNTNLTAPMFKFPDNHPYRNIPMFKVPFLDLKYVLGCVYYYKNSVTMTWNEMEAIKTILKKLTGRVQ